MSRGFYIFFAFIVLVFVTLLNLEHVTDRSGGSSRSWGSSGSSGGGGWTSGGGGHK